MRIVGVLLAAGSGTRFGGRKLLAPLPAAGGVAATVPLGVCAFRNLREALPDAIAVVRPGDDLLAGLLGAEGARVVLCARADEGMGASLACGVAAAADADGWVVALADMPWIRPATIAAVAAALARGSDIVAPMWNNERGHPVGFARRHYAALAALSGDEGARTIIAAHRSTLNLLEAGDAGVVRDVDTPADL
jgi:molybdenum cofactor cytidylyltransferase